MGFFDKAKKLLGLQAGEDEEEENTAPPVPPAGASDPRAARLAQARGRKDRPPLVEVSSSQGQSVEDAILAREAGDKKEARRILAAIDRGAGLRVVLRAAAALEAGDQAELDALLPAVAAEADGYKLWLQVAGALGGAGPEGEPAPGLAMDVASLIQRAKVAETPAWALLWTEAVSGDEARRRTALVELLFADAPLARTVAARDLGVDGAVSDAEAATQYAAFAHGRDSIRRFGARLVADLLELASASGGRS